MRGLTAKIKRIVALLRKGHLDVAWKVIRRKLYSDSLFFGLRRDLTVPFTPPNAIFPLTVRQLCDGDIPALLDTAAAGITGEEIDIRLRQLQMLKAYIPTCYVAVTPDNNPCYMQWLIGPSENAKVQSYFSGAVPLLGPDEALLESAFTPEAYRGLGIMPCAMAQIAQKAADFGARWVIAFVSNDNIPSLKGCKRAGFAPYLIYKKRWRLFHRRLTFTPLPAEALNQTTADWDTLALTAHRDA